MTTKVPIEVVVDPKLAQDGSKVVVRSLDDIERKSKETDKVVQTLKKTFGGLAGALSVREILRASDNFANLQTRIKTATEETGNYMLVSKQLKQIANETGTALKDNVEIFQRVALGVKDLGRTEVDVLKLTKAVQQLGVIGGSTNAGLSAGLLQLGQGLSAGILRAEEFNSIVENIPEVANAIAKGLNTSTGQLRNMVLEGKVLSDDVFRSLLSQTDEIAAKFDKIPLRLSRATNVAKNNISEFLGNIDSAIGGTTGLATAIVSLSENLDIVAVVVGLFATKSLVSLTASLATTTYAMVLSTNTARAMASAYVLGGSAAGSLAAANIGLKASFAFLTANPIGLIITGIATAYILLRDKTDEVDLSQKKFSSSIEKAKSRYAEAAKAGNEYTEELVKQAKALEEVARLEKTAQLARAEDTLKSKVDEFDTLRQKYKSLTPEYKKNGFSPVEAAFIKGQESINRGVRDASRAIDEQKRKIAELRGELSGVAKIQDEVNEKVNESFKSQTNYKTVFEETDRAIADSLTNQETLIKQIEEYEILLTKLPASEEARAKGLEVAIARSQTALADARKKEFDEANRDAEEAAKEAERAFKTMADNIQNSLAGTFKDLFNGTIDSLGDVTDRIKSTFFNVAAEMAAAFATQQFTVNANFVNGSGSGGGASSLLSMGSSLFGGMGSFAGLGNSLNSFGSSQLGTAFTGAPLLPGQSVAGSLGGSSLTGILGAGAMGAIGGGILNNLIGGNELGGTIGGGIGAAAGTAFFGPIGGIIGGLGGSLLGGLFGSEGGTEAAEFSGLTATSGLESRLFGSKNSDEQFAHTIADAVASVAFSLGGLSGVDVSGQLVEGGLNTKQKGGGFLTFQGKDILFDEKDDESLSRALAQLSVEMLRTGEVTNESVVLALQNIQTEGKSLDEVLGDIQFAAAFDSLSLVEEQLTSYEQLMKVLNEQYEAALPKVKELGLEEAKLNEARDKALSSFATDFNTAIQDSILSIVNPEQYELNQLKNTFETIRKDAIAVNGNLLEVERLYQLQRLEISQKYNEELIDNITPLQDKISSLADTLKSASSFNNKLLLGSLGGLSSEGRREEALRQFSTAQSDFNNGTGSFAEVERSGLELLEASKNYFSFTEDYYKDQALVLDFTKSIESDTAKQLTTAEQQLTFAQQQVDLLSSINQSLMITNPANDNSIGTSYNLINSLPSDLLRTGSGSEIASAYIKQVIASQIPQFANGGTASGLSIVGERGPELVNFRGSAKVYSNSQSQDIMGGEIVAQLQQYQAQDSNQTKAVIMMLERVVGELQELTQENRRLARNAE